MVDATIQEQGSKVVTILLKMMDNANQQLLSEALLKFLFFDLATRKSMKLQDEKLQKLNLDWLKTD